MTQHRCIMNRFVAALFPFVPAMQDAGAANTHSLTATAPHERITQFIVKVKTPALPQSTGTNTDIENDRSVLARRAVERVLRDNAASSPARARRSSERVIDTRPMSGAAHVVTLGSPVTRHTADAIAARLQAQPEIEYAEADYRLYRELAPTDPLYAKQWAYGDAMGAARFEGAWDTTTGTANTVIAAVDTGYRPHPDLIANLLPGYDFITDPIMANDGDGRDADASDPGDWVTAEESLACDGTDRFVGNSSWHGTHVAGTIGAVANNEIGGAGGVWHARVLPVRALGKCGGQASDIIDGMRWAVGLSVPGVPDNRHPAKIVNVSLGASKPCSRAMQAAIDDIVAHGASVVAAAGNSGAGVGEPANCRDAIAVAAIDAEGNKAQFSNAGHRIDVGAPGVGIFSTANAGLTVPGEDAYLSASGTSTAAPLVSASLALMLAVEPRLTPERLREKLKASARAYPEGSSCGNTAKTALCGAGMLDAQAAVAAAAENTQAKAGASTN